MSQHPRPNLGVTPFPLQKVPDDSRQPRQAALERGPSHQNVPSPQYFSGAHGFSVGTLNINTPLIPPPEQNAYIQRVARWLSRIDVNSILQDRLKKRTAGTGVWFVEGDLFRSWVEKRGKVLWVTGKPGAGKTFLISSAIDKLKHTCLETNGDRVVLFFFCQYKERPSATDIFKSFLRQLYEQRSQAAFNSVDPIYNESDGSPISSNQVLDLLLQIMGLYKDVYIAIDALDELKPDTQDELLQSLWSTQAANVSFLVTSRPLSPSRFPSTVQVEQMSIGDQNRHDINLFVHHTLQTTGKFLDILGPANPLEEDIVKKIDTKASGMFLLASLQLESLKKCTTQRDLLTKADQLPTAPDSLYKLTMDRIQDQGEKEVALAKRALLWVTYAHAYLTIDDLRSALASVSPETGGIDSLDRPTESMILVCCCGLLVVDEATKIVRLSHFTADEFIRTLPDEIFKAPHALIARHCITYLTSRKNTVSNGVAEVIFDYADQKWSVHAKDALSEGDDTIHDTVRSFVLSCVDYPCQDIAAPGWQRSQPSSLGLTPEVIQPVHLIALHGFTFLFDLPVIRAGWDLRTSTGRTPLHYAAFENNCDLVEQLCSDSPSRVDEVDLSGYTPLMFACRQGHAEVVNAILPHSSTPNLRSTTHDESALVLAAMHNHGNVVEILLAHNEVDLHSQDSQGRTPLMIACNHKFAGIVDLLLRCPTLDVNQSNAIGFTAFTETALGGSVDIFKRLLEHPLQAFNSSKDTALVRAVKLKKAKMVEHLLSLPIIDVNVKCAAKMSPLVAAAETGQESMCKLLLSHPEVDVNVQDEKGYTALMYAAELGVQWLVEVLLSRLETEVNLVNRDRRTALMLACSSSQRRGDIVDLFLKRHDVQLDARDINGHTASMLASEPQDAVGKAISVSIFRSMNFGPGRNGKR